MDAPYSPRFKKINNYGYFDYSKWLMSWLVGWLVGWLAGWLVGWLVNWLVG